MNQDEIYKHLGGVIKKRRKQLELTQQQLAGMLGISRGSLANIETGSQGVLVHQLFRFAEALKLAPADFLMPEIELSNPLQEAWTEAIPSSLKLEHRKQIARLLGTERDQTKGGDSVKTAKK